jgi:MFS family permease
VGNRATTRAVALRCVQFVDVLGVTVVITALPTMLKDLHASSSASSLVVTGYAMFFGGLLVLGARTGDRFGHRRIAHVGIGVFAATSFLAASTPSVAFLVAGRCAAEVALRPRVRRPSGELAGTAGVAERLRPERG